LEEFYDEVLVYGSEDVLDVAQEYSWPASAAARLSYAGYVCGRAPERARELAIRWQPDRPPQVLVVAGGGADAYPTFSAVLEAAGDVHRATGAQFTFVTGPFMPQDDVTALRRRARTVPGAEVRRKIRKHAKVAGADLVIAMAGYNTTVEL